MTLAEAVKSAVLAGDLPGARVAAEAIVKLLADGSYEGAAVVADLAAERERAGRVSGSRRDVE